MKYDLYDFDKTVYPYDSETVFLFHCLFRKPWLLILSPWLLLNLILFFLGFGDKFKGRCFTFLRFIDGEKEAKKFWEKQESAPRSFAPLRPNFCSDPYARNTALLQ